MMFFIIALIVVIGFVIFGAETPSAPTMNNSQIKSNRYTKEDIEYLRKNLFK